MKFKNCEICGSSKTLLIQERISWNNNMFGVLPVHCCSDCGFLFQNPRFSKNFIWNIIKIHTEILLKDIETTKKVS